MGSIRYRTFGRNHAFTRAVNKDSVLFPLRLLPQLLHISERASVHIARITTVGVLSSLAMALLNNKKRSILATDGAPCATRISRETHLVCVSLHTSLYIHIYTHSWKSCHPFSITRRQVLLSRDKHSFRGLYLFTQVLSFERKHRYLEAAHTYG